MDSGAVLAKTAKGVEEVTARVHGLPQKLRSLLIMVDGNATAGDLLAKFGGIPGVEASLAALVEQGFVEIKGTRAAASAAAPSAPAVTETRAQALAKLTRLLHDALGPDADALTSRLEAARSGAEFLAAAERSADTLGALTNPARAQQFRDRAQAHVKLYLGGA
jgi:hypothetical protein